MYKQFDEFLTETGFSLYMTFHGFAREHPDVNARYYYKAQFKEHTSEGRFNPKFKKEENSLSHLVELLGWGSTPDVAFYNLISAAEDHYLYSRQHKKYFKVPNFNWSRGNMVNASVLDHVFEIGANDKVLHASASMSLTRLYGTHSAVVAGINKELQDIGSATLTDDEDAVIKSICDRLDATDKPDFWGNAVGIGSATVAENLDRLEFNDKGEKRTRRNRN